MTNTPASSGKAARRRGCDFERWLVRYATAHGLPASRNLQFRGAGSGGDVTVAGIACELKCYSACPGWSQIIKALDNGGRIAKPPQIWRTWISTHDALVLKQTGCGVAVLTLADDVWTAQGLDSWIETVKEDKQP